MFPWLFRCSAVFDFGCFSTHFQSSPVPDMHITDIIAKNQVEHASLGTKQMQEMTQCDVHNVVFCANNVIPKVLLAEKF